MKCEFLCGGTYWESLVDAELTDEEYALLKQYATEHEDEHHLYRFPPTDGIYAKVYEALEEQCGDDLEEGENVMIWLPVGIRD